MIARRAKELCGMMMIGDGVLALFEPRQHMQLWSSGPPAWERLMQPLVRHPGMVRVLGVLELAAGLAVTRRQYAGLGDGERRIGEKAERPALSAEQGVPEGTA